MDDFEKSIKELRKILEVRHYKLELLICFWVALHLNRIAFVQYIYKLDLLFDKIT